MESQTHTEVIRAPIEVCFDTLVDFVRYPQWFGVVEAVKVELEDTDAQRWRVAFDLNAVLKTIHYTLEYEGQRPGRLVWKATAGDLKAIEGVYELVELEPGLTEATCTQAIDIGMWVPGIVRRAFERSAVADSVRELKKAAEERAETLACGMPD